MIEGYLGLKIEFPFWYNNWDPCDPAVVKLFKEGYVRRSNYTHQHNFKI